MNSVSRGRKSGQGSKWIRPEKRLAIYHRDGFCCAYCGAGAEDGDYLTLDHIVPCEVGGTNHHHNLITACGHCNSSKQDKPMRQWLTALRDQGVDTSKIAARVRRLTAKKLNKAKGKELLLDRNAA